ncbi:MAG: RagB/SusD family nutrient uptake outer membrane protein, partial [Marinirhabdus sp.]
MKKTIITNVKAIVAIALVSIFTVSCTDLEIEATDSIITDEDLGIFNGVESVEESLNNLYNDTYGQLGDQANFFALNEVATDETLVPTRGTDWGDNGIWRTLHAHTWSPTHQFILSTWNNLNQNVFRATQIIDDRSAPSAQQKAEAQFLRAFSMFFVLDLYGVQPFRQPDEGADVNPSVMTAQEAYDFILADLAAAIPNLPSTGPSAETNRASKASANFLMAKLRLNAGRYKGTGGFDNGDMQAVIDAVDAIAADGFALQAGYFDIFTEAVDNETIWYVNTSVGNRIWNGLHYNQNSPDNTGGGWNGFTTLAEFYDSFEGNPDRNELGDSPDERRGYVPNASNAGPSNLGIGYGFLLGQQYDQDGAPLQTRGGQPLSFTKQLPGLSGNTEDTGIRII